MVSYMIPLTSVPLKVQIQFGIHWFTVYCHTFPPLASREGLVWALYHNVMQPATSKCRGLLSDLIRAHQSDDEHAPESQSPLAETID